MEERRFQILILGILKNGIAFSKMELRDKTITIISENDFNVLFEKLIFNGNYIELENDRIKYKITGYGKARLRLVKEEIRKEKISNSLLWKIIPIIISIIAVSLSVIALVLNYSHTDDTEQSMKELKQQVKSIDSIQKTYPIHDSLKNS